MDGIRSEEVDGLCPECGHGIPEGSVNCGVCGIALRHEERSGAAPPSEVDDLRAGDVSDENSGEPSRQQGGGYGSPVSVADVSGAYQTMKSLASDVRSLADFEGQKPDRLGAAKSFAGRASFAVRLMFREKELFVFTLLQCVSIGLAYYLWVQALQWIPEETWEKIGDSDSDSGSFTEMLFFLWSILCIGLATLPLGILSGCMAAVHFLHRQGEESTIARCLKIVMPHAIRLWILHWIDGFITCRQILKRLPKKDDNTSPAERVLGEALYYAWKLGSVGMLPSLVMGKGMIAASKDSLGLLKGHFKDVALLRAGYSAICWIIGIATYVLGMLLLVKSGVIDFDQGDRIGVQIYRFFVWAGIPLLIAVAMIQIFVRPIFIISLCDIYSDFLQKRNESPELEEAPGRGIAALVAFAVLAIITATFAFYFRSWIVGK